MMKRILVATDFSNNAYNSLLYATKLFEKFKCSFYLLHSFEREISTLTSRVDIGRQESLHDKLFEDSQKKLIEWKDAIIKVDKKVNHSFEGLSTSVLLSRKINELIKNKKIDLVVMGTKGASGEKDILLGSNTIQVIRKVKGSPLLVIPRDFKFRPPKNFVFPTDFKHSYKKEVLKAVKKIASLHDSKVKILHISEEESLKQVQKKIFQMIKRHLETSEHEIYWVPKTSKKSQLINEFIEVYGIDISVLIFHRNSLFKKLFRESVVEKATLHTSIPLLVISDVS